MRLRQVSIILSVIFAQSVFSRRCDQTRHQNAIMTALQGAMGPKNLERALAAMTRVEKPVPVLQPAAVPREINLPNARLIEQKLPCQTERMVPMEIVQQTNLPIYPIAPAPAAPQMLYQPNTEVVVPISRSGPNPVFERRGCPFVGPSPASLVNPLLPAASPVSAWAPPTSSRLPPIDPTQVRSHFLRKIPIPPPTL